MTKKECAVIMAYTGTCMLKGDDLKYFYSYLSEIAGRPVYTHELVKIVDEYKETKIKEDFLSICKSALDLGGE